MNSFTLLLAVSPEDAERLSPLIADLERSGHRVIDAGADIAESRADAVIGPVSASERLEDVEAAHIAAVLARHGGNRRQAALTLGVARSTLLARIRRHGL